MSVVCCPLSFIIFALTKMTMEKTNYNTIDRLAHGDVLSRDEWMVLLTSLNADEREYLRVKAAETAVAHYGKGVFVRALIEISSYCKNNCY